jgi:hypothetical protein
VCANCPTSILPRRAHGPGKLQDFGVLHPDNDICRVYELAEHAGAGHHRARGSTSCSALFRRRTTEVRTSYHFRAAAD